MVSNHHLDRVIAKETGREVLSCLTGAELIVLHLRMEGHNYDEIADLCGISRTAVCMRLLTAKRRISRIIPELGALIEDRRQPRIYRTDKTP